MPTDDLDAGRGHLLFRTRGPRPATIRLASSGNLLAIDGEGVVRYAGADLSRALLAAIRAAGIPEGGPALSLPDAEDSACETPPSS